MRNRVGHIFLCSVSILLLSLQLFAQISTDKTYGDERKQAFEVYKANRNLEALPLFEDLLKRNSKDSDVMVGLADCLIHRAATIEDQNAAAKERLRARDLLLKAQQLGNNNNIVLNLLQTIPADGVVNYESGPAGLAMQAGEAAFAKGDFEEAIKNYSRVLELEPTKYSAALFIGDSYFAEKNFPLAGQWYDRASQIDPNTETAYRYYADMLTNQGEMEKARTKAINAVVAEPYNPITWRGLQQWAIANKLQLTFVHIQTPDNTSQKDPTHINININPNQPSEQMSVWLVYSMARARWRGDEFKKHFPSESEYRHSLAEESDALNIAASVLKEDSKKKKALLKQSADLAVLLKLSETQLIEPYVLLSAPDQGIARDYEAYREHNRDKLTEYLSDFIVPPAPSK